MGCESTKPDAGADAGQPCDASVQTCPLGNLIVHVRKDTANGSAISGVTVNISGPESSSGTTDATDKAEFNKIKPGTYTVTARKDCYAPDPKTESAEVLTGGTKEVTLVLVSKCWSDDYDKEISVNSYGRYFKKYKADGTEYSYNFPKKYKILAPVKTGSKITVEVRFKEELQAGANEDDATAVKTKLVTAVRKHWNGKFNLEVEDIECNECGKKSFEVEYKIIWVTSGQDYTLKIYNELTRAGLSGTNMSLSKSRPEFTFAHEFAHCVGLPDEYSYTESTEKVKYIKPDGTLDSQITAPQSKPRTDSDATIMSSSGNFRTLNRHCWNIAIEVQELLTAKLGRNIKCTIK